MLDLAQLVVNTIKHDDEAGIIVHIDYSKFWELLAASVLKSSQHARDSSSIVSKIIELEK